MTSTPASEFATTSVAPSNWPGPVPAVPQSVISAPVPEYFVTWSKNGSATYTLPRSSTAIPVGAPETSHSRTKTPEGVNCCTRLPGNSSST